MFSVFRCKFNISSFVSSLNLGISDPSMSTKKLINLVIYV